MSQTRQVRRGNNYIAGTAARNIDVRTAIEQAPTGEPLRQLRGEARKAKRMTMSIAYVLFLTVIFTLTGMAVVKYVSLQAELTASAERVARYENQLNKLTLANDDEYSKMVNTVDLEEIRRVAIEELGMVYADENQVITYEREHSDYVRQVADIQN
ncbi:MAG: cell division protein FtsL [Lachnospiraceae bacterium]|nr:cell division protein FtsL [Lachnospiraceae bacterium]